MLVSECNTTVYQRSQYSNSFFESINKERNPKSLVEFRNSSCDVYLRHHGDEETVYLAHALVLSYHSEKIKLEHRNRKIPQATDGRLIIDVPRTVCQKALETILEYMYTGNLAIIPNSNAFITQFIFALGHFQINEFISCDFFDNIRSGVIPTNDDCFWEKNSVNIINFIAQASIKSDPDQDSILCQSMKDCSIASVDILSSTRIEPNKKVQLKEGKTAVSALQELLQKRGASIPTYKEKGGSGPPFTIYCHVDELISEATGNSKKEAKHKAAENMLIKLQDDVNRAPGAPSLIKPRESERDLGSIDPDEVQNPVGLLQELMQKNGLAIPEYTAGSETAPPFTHTVKLPASGQSCTGQGSKKSDAKSQAAVRMLYQLKEYGFPLDQSFSTPSSPHPVTELQELLQKRHIRSPSYAYVPHDGTHGHMKEYTCICRVEKFNLEVKARRKNQREARKAAAEQMIQRIQQELECAKLI